jgi:hypothetical protein
MFSIGLDSWASPLLHKHGESTTFNADLAINNATETFPATLTAAKTWAFG